MTKHSEREIDEAHDPDIDLPTMGRLVFFRSPDDDSEPVAAIVARRSAGAEEAPIAPGGDEDAPRATEILQVCAFDPVFGPRMYHIPDAKAAAAKSPADLKPGGWCWPPRPN